MIKQKKILLGYLLEQYKQQLNQTIIPKPGNKITIDMKIIYDHAKKQGVNGSHWLSLVKKSLKRSGDNTLLVNNINGDEVYVSGTKAEAIMDGLVAIPLKAVKFIIKQSKNSKISQKINLKQQKDRPLWKIARQIKADWDPVHYTAKPYVDAMLRLNSIKDMYINDPASQIVAYFLANASQWRGEKAKEIKLELNNMLKRYRQRK